MVDEAKLGLLASAVRGILEFKWKLGSKVRLRNKEAAAEAVFVEAILGPRTGVADSSLVLDLWQQLLALDGGRSIQWMRIVKLSLDGVWSRTLERVHSDENVAKRFCGDMLQDVHVVCEGNLVNVGLSGRW